MKDPLEANRLIYRVGLSSVLLAIFVIVLWLLLHLREMQTECNDHDFSYSIYGIIFLFLAISFFGIWAVNKIIRDQVIYSRNLEVRTQKMRELAITDGLTKIFNHRYFEHKLEKEWERFERFKHSLACVIVDIDDFKKINDTFGHRAGDLVLRGVAELLRESLREVDIVSRYGGEEFAILLFEKPNSPIGLKKTMEKIRKKIEKQEFIFDGQKIRVTASFGGALVPDPKIPTPDQLVHFADRAMYFSKKNGKNQVAVFGEQDCC